MSAAWTCSSGFSASAVERRWTRTALSLLTCAARCSLYASSHQRIRSPSVQRSGFRVTGSRPRRWRSARCSSSTRSAFASAFVCARVGEGCQVPSASLNLTHQMLPRL
jgi:hypothetical protein